MAVTDNCDCLTADDPALTLHYGRCPAAGADTDSSPERTLAELASLRDIDTALYCLREVRGSR